MKKCFFRWASISCFQVVSQSVSQWVSESVSQWQGHLLSCLWTAKKEPCRRIIQSKWIKWWKKNFKNKMNWLLVVLMHLDVGGHAWTARDRNGDRGLPPPRLRRVQLFPYYLCNTKICRGYFLLKFFCLWSCPHSRTRIVDNLYLILASTHMYIQYTIYI